MQYLHLKSANCLYSGKIGSDRQFSIETEQKITEKAVSGLQNSESDQRQIAYFLRKMS